MANMFSGNIKKTIPKNLEECYETDNMTRNLWVWAERLEQWGLAICVLMAIIGVIEIISTGIQVAEILDDYNNNEYTGYYSVSDAVFDCLLNWVFYCFLEFCVYHMLALIVGSLATIVQNTKINANVALYNAAKDDGEQSAKDDGEQSKKDDRENANIPQSKPTHKWLCKCGKMITSTPCPYCGKGDDEKEKEPDRDCWKCMGCGKINSGDKKVCDCGCKVGVPTF